MKLLSSKQELRENLIKIIEQSQKKLIIISPFIHLGDNNLNKELKRKKNILEIYTKVNDKLKSKNEETLSTLKKLVASEEKLFLVDYLHAKIYINDKTALLSSMNFNDGAFAKSIDFGIITENHKELEEVIDYCKKYIFIYNPKCILDDLSALHIDAKFDQFNCLTLTQKKKSNASIQCSIKNYGRNQDSIYFYLDLPRNTKSSTSYNIIHDVSEKHGVEIKRSSTTGLSTKRYYFRLEEKEYPVASLIPVINMSRKKILGILTDVYNYLIDE